MTDAPIVATGKTLRRVALQYDMYELSGHDRPWSRRLDHLICEVPDIETAYARFLDAGFPSAWPVGRFWPGGQMAGIALGGVNLELVQPDQNPPLEARIRTLAFEPYDLAAAAVAIRAEGFEVEVFEKWEYDPGRLLGRGFTEDQSRAPQLICRNAYPRGEMPIPFFFCAYGPHLHARLAPAAFPGLPPVTRVVLGLPRPAEDWRRLDALFGLPRVHRGVDVTIDEAPTEHPEVVAIHSDRGAIELGDLRARFRFT